jgi:hypothetical protein
LIAARAIAFAHLQAGEDERRSLTTVAWNRFGRVEAIRAICRPEPPERSESRLRDYQIFQENWNY